MQMSNTKKPNYAGMRTREIIGGASSELYRRYKVGMWQTVSGLQSVALIYIGAKAVGVL